MTKLFVWSFISGFAERFVPDTLNRFTQNGGDSTKPIPNPAPQGKAAAEKAAADNKK